MRTQMLWSLFITLVLFGGVFARDDDDDDDTQYEDEAAAASEVSVVGPVVSNAVLPVTPAKIVEVSHTARAELAKPVKADYKVSGAIDSQNAHKALSMVAKHTQIPSAETDSKNAHTAAKTAMHAAKVANKVAMHSAHITKHAKSALKKARHAIHQARVDTTGLSSGQRESLKAAEAKLQEATKKATYGEIKDAKYVKSEVDDKNLQKMDTKMEKIKSKGGSSQDGDYEAMRTEIRELRGELKRKGNNDPDVESSLKDLEGDIDEMEAAEKKGESGSKSHDEMKAELERLRTVTRESDSAEPQEYPVAASSQEDSEPQTAQQGPANLKEVKHAPAAQESPEVEATPVEEKGIDIDTAMPYGDLEPFGREDTAQELTESSIKESDDMVDQMERAEVAEEKRAVFRALTRLRGAAITSFDGVARSQTGNIDEYNKIHKWRGTHPLHHLADEESDVSKWAFPDNAD